MTSKNHLLQVLALVLFTSLLMAGGARSQTKDETVKFVTGKLNALFYFEEFRQFNTVDSTTAKITVGITTAPGHPAELIKYDRVNWKDVTSVTVLPHSFGADKSTLAITLGGKFKRNTLVGRGLEAQWKSVDVESVVIFCKVEREEVNRLAKGLKHLCSLSGAKLVADELFK